MVPRALADSRVTHRLHNKSTLRINLHPVNRVVSFLQPRRSHLPLRPGNRRYRNLLFPRSLVIPSNCIPQNALKKISNHPKSCGPRRAHISFSIANRRICVVHHKRLLSSQASFHQHFFSMPRAQHIQADPHVRIKKTFPIKRRLPRTLYPNKNHRFHNRLSLFSVTSVLESP